MPTHEPALQYVRTDDGSMTLYCAESGQTFHSESGAITESRWVFLRNGLAAQLQQANSIRVLEIGFGTGLNFLLTGSACWQAGVALEYVACDRSCISQPVMAQLGYDEAIEFAHIAQLWNSWLGWTHQLNQASPDLLRDKIGPISVELCLGDASAFASQKTGDSFDVIYLDAFSPEATPSLWSRCFLVQLFRLTKPGGRLVTYCSKSLIQRRLRESGYQIEKTPGPPGGKREVLIAHRPISPDDNRRN